MKKRFISFGTINITEKAKELVNKALDTANISNGVLVREFEKKFAALHGVSDAVAVSSGTDALAVALTVLYDYGAKRGDEIILPAMSFVATGNAVLHAGFEPVFVDIDRTTLNIEQSQISEKITKKTRAILPVHLMGKPADMDTIEEIAKKHKLLIIEDAAEAHGAEYKGRKVGAIGDMAAFSLYIAHIITTGEGGIITTNDRDKAALLRSIRAHGRACKCETCLLSRPGGTCVKRFDNIAKTDIRFVFERMGFSAKMNELEAAIGLGVIDDFVEIVKKRRENFYAMSKIVQKYDKWLNTVEVGDYEKIGPHALPILVREDAPFNRDEFVSFLEENGIDSRNLFQSMPTQCPQFKYLGFELGDFKEAEYVADFALHIGVHQDINDDDIDYIETVFKNFSKKY